MSLARWSEPHFKQSEPSRREAKIGRRAEQLAQWTAVCRLVDQRDQYRCRACGHRCDVKAITLIDRAHRHHVIYRSAGGPDETWNIATLCAGCHDAQHRLGLLDVRGDADRGLEIWRNSEQGWFLSRRELRPGQVEKD